TGCQGRRADPAKRSQRWRSRRVVEPSPNGALSMAELATIRRPYAETLFKVAQKGDSKSWSGQVEALANVAADPQLRAFADNPKTVPAQVFDVLTAAANQPFDPNLQNFLRVVIDNGRLAALPEIIGQFHALVNA